MANLLRGAELSEVRDPTDPTDPTDAAYEQLGRKVDAFHERVQLEHPGALTCGAGCSQCCHSHLSIVPFEFRRLAAAVLSLDEATAGHLRGRLAAGRNDSRCPLLDDTGRCLTYSARPLICRSHGLPIQVEGQRDVCPLNFVEGPPLNELSAAVVFGVDSANAILGVISTLARDDPTARVDLLDGLAELLKR